ncbi:MAG: hypothetical protein D8M57_13005 [Candidatus Scalindua sp. AMX11]|nr:MAG: hypothetical protein DWQ00_12085 [Candidatus Scalindua sp.]NOG83811.1 hypothetical protein [Planctomycetota bacterium]RZV82965.1 MAG: hypothetical protein EX341_09240 [Candidatus Scalindua sp. SCAELEC01]TDE64413.1 MAG: hypothetical protein D8M57_13005 [Candidatus Scalindua sp. AMX11]GJQ59739.1 MAG: hypothetical protein SCALA701_25400 [Candidatus Scalindua sp.]
MSQERVSQGDIFQDIEILENIDVEKSIIRVQKILFPFVVCLNQECDLEKDYKNNESMLCNNNLLHIAIAPAFIFDQYLTGTHWGSIFSCNKPQKRKDTIIRNIMDNEIPRYHYLKFSELDMPELIIDFKHFFTVNRNKLYNQLDSRLCSLDDLFKEKINQRFSNYVSRIGLPEHKR